MSSLLDSEGGIETDSMSELSSSRTIDETQHRALNKKAVQHNNCKGQTISIQKDEPSPDMSNPPMNAARSSSTEVELLEHVDSHLTTKVDQASTNTNQQTIILEDVLDASDKSLSLSVEADEQDDTIAHTSTKDDQVARSTVHSTNEDLRTTTYPQDSHTNDKNSDEEAAVEENTCDNLEESEPDHSIDSLELSEVPFDRDASFYDGELLWYEFFITCCSFLKNVSQATEKSLKLINRLRLGRSTKKDTMYNLAWLAPDNKIYHRYLERRLPLLWCFPTTTSLWSMIEQKNPVAPLLPTDLAPGPGKPQESCLTCLHNECSCRGTTVTQGKCQTCSDLGSICYWQESKRLISTFGDALDYYGHSNSMKSKKRSREDASREEAEVIGPSPKKSRNGGKAMSKATGKAKAKLLARDLCFKYLGKSFPIALQDARMADGNKHPTYCGKSLRVLRETKSGPISESCHVDSSTFKHLRQAIEFRAFEVAIKKKKVRELTYLAEYRFTYKYASASTWLVVREEDWIDFDTNIRTDEFAKHKVEFTCTVSAPTELA